MVTCHRLNLTGYTMKKILIVLLLLGCNGKSETLLLPQDFKTRLETTENALLLDVRTQEEVQTGALEGAINIAYDNNFADKLGTLEQKPIFVYCAVGGRSAKAATLLREKGYSVYELKGGIQAWKEAGLPVK